MTCSFKVSRQILEFVDRRFKAGGKPLAGNRNPPVTKRMTSDR